MKRESETERERERGREGQRVRKREHGRGVEREKGGEQLLKWFRKIPQYFIACRVSQETMAYHPHELCYSHDSNATGLHRQRSRGHG